MKKNISRRSFLKGAAIGAAGLTMAGAGLKVNQAKAEDEIAWDAEYDVVVLGYGGAGANAAVAAYEEINEIIDAFKKGEEKIYLKRMGRSEEERWYDAIDFSNISVLVIEWTHGGNKALNGIDIPILLNSTPEETREHRRLRARDGKTDSAFTTMVLEIEQEELDDRAPYAKIIIAKSGEVLDPQSFRKD